MTKKKIKTEYIIIAVIIVMLAFLVIKKEDKMHYDLPEIELIEQDQITKIEIQKPDATITLVKTDGKWMISPQNYPTESSKIDQIIKEITDLSVTTLVSESKNYVPYGLDKENKIIVRAYNREKNIREFEVGKVASTYHHTFIKLPEDKNVYHARNSFRSNFDEKLDNLRDKKVFKIDKNEISEIKIIQEDSTLELAKKAKLSQTATPAKEDDGKPIPPPKDVVSWVSNDGKLAKSDALDGLLNQLSNLSCDEFIEGKSKSDYKTPVYSLSLKGNKEYLLKLFQQAEKGGKYPAISSENPYPFLLSTYTAESIMKKPEDLVEMPVDKNKKEEKKKK